MVKYMENKSGFRVVGFFAAQEEADEALKIARMFKLGLMFREIGKKHRQRQAR